MSEFPSRPAKPPRPRAEPKALPSLDPETQAYYQALCGRWGVQADRYRSSILLRRTAATLRALRASGLGDGIRVIGKDEHAAERALGAVMIGVTAFFRDSAVFNALPPLLQTLHQDRGGLHVMSIGCSDGSELYSAAMLLAQCDLLSTSQLLGVDCRPRAITAAVAGIYESEAAEAIPAPLRSLYCDPVENTSIVTRRLRPLRGYVQIAEPLRRACQWIVGDVFENRWYDESRKADVIFCRNLAIYLKPEASAELWSRMMRRLTPGGLIVTGKAERPPANLLPKLTRLQSCIYKKVSDESHAAT